MKRRLSIAFFVLVLSAFGASLFAEPCHYSDDRGVVHFVDDLSQVPAAYRSQVKERSPLPEVHVVGRPGQSGGARSQDSASSESSRTKPAARVEVFTTSWCGYCKKLTAFLNSRGIPFTAYDIEKDADANRTYKELGGRGVPLSLIGDTVVRGYDPDAVMAALGRAR